MKRLAVPITILLVVCILGLAAPRIYGAYVNEKKGALLRAKEAEDSAEQFQEMADRVKARVDCASQCR